MVWDAGLLKMLKAWSRVYRPYKDIMPCHETLPGPARLGLRGGWPGLCRTSSAYQTPL